MKLTDRFQFSRRNSPDALSRGVYRKIANLMGWLIVAIGALALLSWVIDVDAGKRVLPSFPTMKFNTALCFIVIGFIIRRKSQLGVTFDSHDSVIAVLALLVFAVSALTLLEYGLGWQLGIDNLVIMDTETAPEDWPGRMSVATALCFSVLALASLTALMPVRHATLIQQLLALSVVIIAGSALLGYVYGIQQLRLSIFSSMALHTSILFVLSGSAILIVRPRDGLMSSATSHYIGGRSLRRLLPFIIVTPVLMGWLSLRGVAGDYYTAAFGFALTSLSSILVLGFVGWLGAEALNLEEERFRSTIDSSPVSTIMIDENGIIRMANRLAHSLFRYPADELLGLSVEQLIPAEFCHTHRRFRRDYMRSPEQRMMGEGRELFALRQDGTRFRAEIALNPVQTAEERFVMAAIVDITERLEAEQRILSLNRIHKVLSGINTLIVRVQNRDVLCKEATRITVEEGQLPGALVVQHDRESGSCRILHAHATDAQFEKRALSSFEVDTIRESLQTRQVVVCNNLAAHRDNGELVNLIDLGIGALGVFPLTSSDSSQEVALVLYQHDRFSFDDVEMKLLREVAGDISFALDTMVKRQQLAQLTHYDSVTDLPNRLLLGDRLKQAIFQADSQGSAISILYVDIDRFKQVNDSLGHAGGDDVLRKVAERIIECVDNTDTVSRWGADEFIVLLTGQNAANVTEMAHCINGVLHSVIVLDDSQELFISCSIGIAEYPRDGKDMDGLIISARSAMATIKELGGNDFRHFVVQTDRPYGNGLALETALRQAALAQNQFQLFYQPQVDIPSRQVLGMEALVRWFHPAEGMIAPDSFIPLAEKTGLIIPIGEWVLREACQQGAASKGLKVAVNLSARQFHQEDLVTTVRQILDESGMPPTNLELEITESALIYDVESAIDTMTRLSDLGVSISLDDFGTGYSSLSYLKRFPIDTLKIDKSFIAEVTTDRGSEVIVNTIIAMAHSLELKVIAEGVETEDQLAMLHERGCDQAQGYLFARPLLYKEAIEILES